MTTTGMFDFRLHVFHTVATRLNFTKAAEELFISQPAVTRHVQEIESHFKVKLFERNGTRIRLTPAGEVLQQYTRQLFELYRNLEFDLNHFSKKRAGQLRIGASTSVAQYVLPPVLAAFHQKFRDVKVSLAINNTEQVEHALRDQSIDLGIVEGRTRNKTFRYTEFIKDELVLIANSQHSLARKEYLKPADLLHVPLLLREPGSGTLEVLAHALKPLGIRLSQLKKEMEMASTESIKRYLLNSSAMSFLSIHSVLNEIKQGELTIIDVKGLDIKRFFYFIHPQGQPEGLADLFMRFALHYNFRL